MSLSGNGSLSHQNQYVGYSGTGTFTQSGGTNTLLNGGELWLGNNTGSNGTYNLGGSGQLSTTGECVGWNGTGNFTQTGGTNIVGNSLYLGASAVGSSGTYSFSGGQLLAIRES